MTVNEDQPGPMARRQTSRGGAVFQSVEKLTPANAPVACRPAKLWPIGWRQRIGQWEQNLFELGVSLEIAEKDFLLRLAPTGRKVDGEIAIHPVDPKERNHGSPTSDRQRGQAAPHLPAQVRRKQE